MNPMQMIQGAPLHNPVQGGNPMAGPALGGQPPVANDPAQAKSGWMSFFDRLSQSPEMQQALLAFGATAMQPREPGVGHGAAIGRGAMAGMQAHTQATERKDAREDRTLAREMQERQVATQERGQTAQERQADRAADQRDRAFGLQEETVEHQRTMQERADARAEAEADLRWASYGLDVEMTRLKMDQIRTQTEALRSEIEGGLGGKPTGEAQQVALRAVRGMSEEEVAALGGEDAAVAAWTTYISAVRGKKTASEFELDVMKTLNQNPAFIGRRNQEAYNEAVAAMVGAYEREFETPRQKSQRILMRDNAAERAGVPTSVVDEAQQVVTQLRSRGQTDEQILSVARNQLQSGGMSEREFKAVEALLARN